MAKASSAATSSTDAVRTVPPSVPAAPAPACTCPKAPKSTLASERFIALLISWVRMAPLAPTSAPATMSTLLPSTKPVIAAAVPVKLLSMEMITGMSAPPMGSTKVTPSTIASTTKRASRPMPWPITTMTMPMATIAASSPALSSFCAG